MVNFFFAITLKFLCYFNAAKILEHHTCMKLFVTFMIYNLHCQWPLTKECTRISAVIVTNIEVQGESYNYKECFTVET